MNRLFRALVWRVFGVPSVVLVDFDGYLTPAFVRRNILRQPFAYRWWLIGVWCDLLPEGKVRGVSYVDEWQPLFGEVMP